MAATPRYKIYNPENQYVSACKYPEESAMLAACLGAGATIRDGHAVKDIVWAEGKEKQSASESYDFVAETIARRQEQRYRLFQHKVQ